jgi:nucleoside-diphosphate-sugar epimerase
LSSSNYSDGARTARTVGITGATGLVGRSLVKAFSDSNWRVVAFSRHPDKQKSGLISFRSFDLRTPNQVDIRDVDVLIHCAVEDYSHNGNRESANVEGSRRLFDIARSHGVAKLVFISSIAAKRETSSPYGFDKTVVEGFLDPNRDLIIRPGLVVGDGSMFRALYATISRIRVAPIFQGGHQPIYTIGIDDLVHVIHNLVANQRVGTYVVAAPDPVSLRSLYKQIAQKAGVRVYLIPLPFRPVILLVETIEKLGIALPVKSKSLKGIPNMRAIDVSSEQDLGLQVKPLTLVLADLKMSRIENSKNAEISAAHAE